MKLEEAWLKCNISEGLLPEEVAVTCKTINNDLFSFFIARSLINFSINSVKVSVLDCKEDSCLIFLPTMPIESLGRTVMVSREDVKDIKI